MQNERSQSRNFVKPLAGVVMVAFIGLAAVAYLTTRVSVNNFTAVAAAVAVVALLATYYNLLPARAAIIFVAMAVVLTLGVRMAPHSKIKIKQFQAVFMANGQVYFGHLNDSDSKTPTLTNVYYLQSTQPNPQNTTSGTTQTPANQPKISLNKLGNELHGPDDLMVLKDSQILFWENLKDSSKVVQAIKQDQQKH